MFLFCALVGDRPERIVLSCVDLTETWPRWKATDPQIVLEPQLSWEGAGLPTEPSRSGVAQEPVCQLRDPAIYEEDGRLCLQYSGAGEQDIGLARLVRRQDAASC